MTAKKNNDQLKFVKIQLQLSIESLQQSNSKLAAEQIQQARRFLEKIQTDTTSS